MEMQDGVNVERRTELSRREIVGMVVGAGLAASGAASVESTSAVEEKSVQITTPDGTCDAAFIYPLRGAHAGVLVWTDAFGLRPAMRGFGRRLAEAGYCALVPNPFYREGTAADLRLDPLAVSFANPDDAARLRKVMSSVQASGAAEKDSEAYQKFLDAQPQVDTERMLGVQGYCMGGALAFRTAAALPERIGAGASFHGGGLVTDQPNSPHRLIPKIKARMYVGIASNDDAREPDAKTKLREAFEAAHVPFEIEVYSGLHGWCVPDMPPRDGHPTYNEPDAEKAWAKLMALYQAALR